MKKLFLIVIAVLLFPSFAMAFEVTGWIPYWEAKNGPKDARNHLDSLTEIHPFAFVMKENGSLKDLGGLKKSAWTRLFKDARKEGVEIIPTIMSSDTEAIHNILSDEDDRGDLVEDIVKLVKRGKYDGIDIDFEGKKFETRDYFSQFLTELNEELGSKTLVCTIEARTPPDSLYTVIPNPIKYVNDYNVIGKVCDRVNIMTYDQQRADIKLNNLRSGSPYYPLADAEWVKKVIELTIQTIPREKIRLGVGTYGRETTVTVQPNWLSAYTSVRAVNPPDAWKVADKEKIKPIRNKAGEMEFTYFSDPATKNLVQNVRIPSSTTSANEAVVKALAYANQTGQTLFVNHISWSDAEAIEDKVELAKRYNLAGVAIFKIDANEDQTIWDLFE